MNSFMLANELIQYFRNTSIATAVTMVLPSPQQVSCVLHSVGSQFPCVDIHLACASLVPLFELVPRILHSHTSLDEVDTRSYVSKVKMTM